MSKAMDRLCEMVRIGSESGNEQRFVDWLAQRLTKELGAECRKDEHGNLIGKVQGTDEGLDPVMLCAHADTVKPGADIEPVLENGVLRSGGQTVLGADDKAGIAAIWTGLERARRRPPVEIVITRQEEVGLKGAKNLDLAGLKARMGFVFDGDELDVIVIGGPSHYVIDAVIKGRAAHAGMEPEKGISAIKAAARAIARLPEGRLDQDTTANVGIFEGGRIRNGVPEKATVQAECRSLRHERAEEIAQLYRRTLEEEAEALGAKAEVKVELEYRAIQLPEDAEPVELARRAVEKVLGPAQLKVICGGTDASIFNAAGLSTVVLGMGARDAHTTNEHIVEADLERAVQIVVGLLEGATDGA